jgi:hypothetical protein
MFTNIKRYQAYFLSEVVLIKQQKSKMTKTLIPQYYCDGDVGGCRGNPSFKLMACRNGIRNLQPEPE